MKLILKNNNYVNPLTKEVLENVYVVDGEFSDIPLLKKMKIAFWLCIDYKKVVFQGNELTPKQINKIEVLDADVLQFTEDKEVPTYITKDGATQDLFEFLKNGGVIDGSETIDVGYPTYTSIQKYLLKDNIGDALVFNPNLDAIGLQLAQSFVLKTWKLNGEPLGVQFKFDK